jgi:hypothetical protein
MICSNYELLTHSEKVQFMGKLCHASQSDDSLFEIAQEIIRLGEVRGLFDNVKILPDHEPTDTGISTE